ncbi:glycosyltransferase family 1 protein [soil metagenome]
MRIAMFTDRYYPDIDGISIHVHELCLALSKKGHAVVLYAPKPDDDNQQIQTSEFIIRYIPCIPLPLAWDARMAFPFSIEILSEMKEFKADVVHFHTPFMIGFQGVIAAKLLNIPLVGTFHTYFMEPEYLKRIGLDKMKLDKNEILHKVGWNYSNFFYDRADIVISPSKYARDDLIKNHLKAKIEVISNGIECTIGKINSVFNLPERYFLYVGRMSKEKNIDELIEAFAQVSRNISDISLVLVGTGPEEKLVKKMIHTFQLEKRIVSLGQLAHEELVGSNIYRDALALVTTSTSENQPISILEGMKHGLPIVGVDARGVSELIQGNGIVCSPHNIHEFAEALEKIALDKKLYSRFKAKSLRLLQKHSFDYTTLKLEELYERSSKIKEKRVSGHLHPKQFLEEVLIKMKNF